MAALIGFWEKLVLFEHKSFLTGPHTTHFQTKASSTRRLFLVALDILSGIALCAIILSHVPFSSACDTRHRPDLLGHPALRGEDRGGEAERGSQNGLCRPSGTGIFSAEDAVEGYESTMRHTKKEKDIQKKVQITTLEG